MKESLHNKLFNPNGTRWSRLPVKSELLQTPLTTEQLGASNCENNPQDDEKGRNY